MLKRKHRLAKQTEVRLTFAKGRGFFSPYFLAKFLKTSADATPRFTVVVSTKVSKKAVDRNRQKRIVREILRLNLSKFRPGDYIISLKPASKKLSAGQLREELLKLLKTTKLIS